MHFFKLLSLAIIPLASALPAPSPARLFARDGAAVNASIAQVTTDLVGLNNSVTAFSGGLFNIGKALKVQSATSKLSKSLQSAIDTAQASAPFTDDESFVVGVDFLNLQPQIYSTLDNLISKKPDFDKVAEIISLRKTVLQSLQQQKTLSGELGDAVTAKLTAAFAALAPGINKGIQDKFTTAINAYSVKGSGIPLPPIPSIGN